MIENEKMLDVINYHSFGISIKTKDNSYWVDPMKDSMPARVPLLKDEIKYINTSSRAFQDGWLFFDEEFEKEIYEDLLRIPNWKDIIRPDKIREILCDPTIEGLQSILDIKNIAVFDIVRGILVNLKNADDDSVTTRVERIINERYKELQNKIYTTNIMLKPKDTIITVSAEDVDNLKQQNEAMQAEMAKMRKMMEDFSKSNKVETVADNDNINKVDDGENDDKNEKPQTTTRRAKTT